MEVRDELAGIKDFIMEMPKVQKESNGDNAVGMRKTGWREQFKPGYRPFSINWDNLSSEDQDIASALVIQTSNPEQGSSEAPTSAQIETPQRRGPAFMDMGDIPLEGIVDAAPVAAPVIPNGQTEVLPQWRRLSNAIKGFLADNYGIADINEYNDMLNDSALQEAIVHDLKCHGLM